MGRAKKLKVLRKPKNVALADQIENDNVTKPTGRVKVKRRRDEDDTVSETYNFPREDKSTCRFVKNISFIVFFLVCRFTTLKKNYQSSKTSARWTGQRGRDFWPLKGKNY